eukprot:Rhum_TRINITY_DN23041_c0_g1::Rhum_TRINITY_DN23041_c0_g1_i1::g.176946::m.176946
MHRAGCVAATRVLHTPYFVKGPGRISLPNTRWDEVPKPGRSTSRGRDPVASGSSGQRRSRVHGYETSNRLYIEAACVAQELCYNLHVEQTQKLATALAVTFAMRGALWDAKCVTAFTFLVHQLHADDFALLKEYSPRDMETSVPFFSMLLPHKRNARIFTPQADAKPVSASGSHLASTDTTVGDVTVHSHAHELARMVTTLLTERLKTLGVPGGRVLRPILLYTASYSVLPSAHSSVLIQAIHDSLSIKSDVSSVVAALTPEEIVKLFRIFGAYGASINERTSALAPEWAGTDEQPNCHNIRRIMHAVSLVASKREFLVSLTETEMVVIAQGAELVKCILPCLFDALCERLVSRDMYKGFSMRNLTQFMYRVAMARVVHPTRMRECFAPVIRHMREQCLSAVHADDAVFTPATVGLLSKAMLMLKLRDTETLSAVIDGFIAQTVSHFHAKDKPVEAPSHVVVPTQDSILVTLYLALQCMSTLNMDMLESVEKLCAACLNAGVPGRDGEFAANRAEVDEEDRSFRCERIVRLLSFLYIGKDMPPAVKIFVLRLLQWIEISTIRLDVAGAVSVLGTCMRMTSLAERRSVKGLAATAVVQTRLSGSDNVLDLSMLEDAKSMTEIVDRCVQQMLGEVMNQLTLADVANDEGARRAFNDEIFPELFWALGHLPKEAHTTVKVFQSFLKRDDVLSAVHPQKIAHILKALVHVRDENLSVDEGLDDAAQHGRSTTLRHFCESVCEKVLAHALETHVLREFDSKSYCATVKALYNAGFVTEYKDEVNALTDRILSDHQLVSSLLSEEALAVMEVVGLLRGEGVRDPRLAEKEVYSVFLAVITKNLPYIAERDPVTGVGIVRVIDALRAETVPPVILTAVTQLGGDILSDTGDRLSPYYETVLLRSLLTCGAAKPQIVAAAVERVVSRAVPISIKRMKWLLYGLAKTSARGREHTVASLCSLATVPVSQAAPSFPPLEFVTEKQPCDTADLTLVLWSLCRLRVYPEGFLHLTVAKIVDLERQRQSCLGGVKVHNVVTLLTGLTSPETLDFAFLKTTGFFDLLLKRAVSSGALKALDYSRLSAVVSGLVERRITCTDFFREARATLAEFAKEKEKAKPEVP